MRLRLWLLLLRLMRLAFEYVDQFVDPLQVVLLGLNLGMRKKKSS